MKQTNTTTVDRREYLKVFIVFFILFAILLKTEPMGWNDGSRMAQIQSLVEYGSFSIDNSVFSTGDKYFFNNHFYSDKPPILALYASPFYFVLHLFGFSFENNAKLTYYLVTLLSIGCLSILGLVVFRKIIRDFFYASNEWANITTFIVGAGTLVLPYSLVFNNHLPSGVLVLLGFFFLLNFRRNSRLKNALYSGLFTSLAGSIDINCFLFIPFILIPIFRKSMKAGLVSILSCLPVIALYLFLNLYTSGSLMPPAMNAPLWNYPGSVFSQENLSGLAHHNSISDVLFYAFHMVLGNRGLISHTPILLVSIVGIFALYRQKNSKFQYKTEYSYMLLATLLYVGIYIFRTTNYSGWAFGIRWFASLMFILCLPIASLESAVKSSKTTRTLFLGIACLSIFVALIGAYFPLSPTGSELQERLSPTITIFANIQLMISDCIAPPPTKSPIIGIVKTVRLVLVGFVVYFLLYRFTKDLGARRISNSKQNS